MTAYLEGFVTKMIEQYIPEGKDTIAHIDCREYMYEYIFQLIEEGKLPRKLSAIKYLCMNYRRFVYTNLSMLN